MDLPRRTSGPQLSHAGVVLALYSGLAALGLVIGALRGHVNVYFYGGVPVWWRLAIGPAIGIALALLVVFLTRLVVHRFEWARRLHRFFRGLLGNLHERDVFILALASSVGEEVLFRGALLPWIGLWASTLVFALLHIGPGVRYLPWTALAFVIGLVFGAMYMWTGDLGGPIVAHFVINFLNLGYIRRVELPEEA